MYTCSITNINLLNKEVVFIPLNKNENRDKRNTKNIYTIEEFWEPTLLPIFGKFDDNDFIIEEDKNTKILEDFFELSIKDIYKTCLSSRSILSSSYSAPFKNYKRKFDTSDIDSANPSFSPEILLEMDFSYEEETDSYIYIGDSRIFLRIKIKEETNFVSEDNDVLDEYGMVTYSLLNNKEELLANKTTSKLFAMKYIVEDIIKIIGYSYIYEQDKKENVNLILPILNNLNGMFISRKVYDILVENSYSEYGSIKNDSDLTINRSTEGKSIEEKLIKNYVSLTASPKYLFNQLNPEASASISSLQSNKKIFFEFVLNQLENKNLKEAIKIVSQFSSIYLNKNMDKELNVMKRLCMNMDMNNLMFKPNVMNNEDCTPILLSKIAELTMKEAFIEVE